MLFIFSDIVEKFQWNQASTLLLIDEYKKIYHKFRNPKVKKKKFVGDNFQDNAASRIYSRSRYVR